MSNINLPTVPASEVEITKEWLQAVLFGLSAETAITSLEGKRIGEGYGFASNIYRYQWQSHGAIQSVVVKLWDTDGGAGFEEVLFYQTFRPVGTRVPMCFYSAYDKARRKAILLLEDLKDSIQGDVLELLDLERAKGVARNLARLHATWLAHPKLELPWIFDVSTWQRDINWFHSRRVEFLERFPNHLNGLARLLLDRIELAPVVANERLKGTTVSILHGDFHLDNIIFEKQTEPVLLDWSRPAKGAPAFNLVTLLLFMTPLQNFDKVFDCYITEFNMASQISLSRTALEKQIGGEFLRAFATSTCGVARWQPKSQRGVQVLEAGIKQTNQAVDFLQRRDPALFSFLH